MTIFSTKSLSFYNTKWIHHKYHEAILYAFEIHNQINLAKLDKDLLWQKLIRVHGCISVKLCYHQFGYFLRGANMHYETQYLDQH